MPKRFRFVADVRNPDYDIDSYGPLFSLFLPKGIEDALVRNTDKYSILLWFEPKGKVDDFGIIKFDRDGSPIEHDIAKKQGILDSGPLYGEIQLRKTTQLSENSVKKIVKIICAESTVLLNILRFNFGQYWLRKNLHWDSTTSSLGFFCKLHNLHYYQETKKNWEYLIPNKPTAIIRATARISKEFSEYLTEDNFKKLKQLFSNFHSPSDAQKQLIEANISFNNEDYSKSFIYAVTALEMGIYTNFKRMSQAPETIQKAIEKISNLRLKEKLVVVSFNVGSIPNEEISESIDAIDIRNRIVHESYQPTSDDVKKLRILLIVTSQIIGEPASFLVTHLVGNSVDLA